MQVSIETTSGLERRMTVGLPGADVEKEITNRLRQLARTRRIDGFRPGKVPLSIIKGRFGAAVREEVLNEAIRRGFYDAIVKEKINPAGGPTIESVKGEEGQDIEFIASFEVYPEVEVQGLGDISIEKSASEVQDADVDNMLDTLRKQQREWVEADKAIESGDQAIIDFLGKIDGEAFQGGESSNFPLEIGAGGMIPGFEDGVIGMKAGEDKVIEVSFPEDYHVKELAGKPATFDIKVHKVNQPQLPEVDDAFAEKFGISEGGVEALKSDIRKNMERELEQALKARTKGAVLDAILDKNPIDIPAALVSDEIERLRKEAVARFTQGRNIDPSKVPQLPDEMFKAEAEKRVRMGLVVREIIASNELNADADRVRALIDNIAQSYENPEEIVNWYYEDNSRLENIQSLALEDQVVDLVLEQATISEKQISFDEAMNRNAQ
jgi:trigger factor